MNFVKVGHFSPKRKNVRILVFFSYKENNNLVYITYKKPINQKKK